MTPRAHQRPCPPDPTELFCRRARRQARRGNVKGALTARRAAVHFDEQNPRLWTLYAAACARAGRYSEAELALKQALWLRRRRREEVRLGVTQILLESLRASRKLSVRQA